MRNFRFENQGAISYLVYEVQEDDKLDEISLNMLSGNKARGIADTTFMQMDDQKFIRYNVTAKITANQFFTRSVSKKSFLGILTGIADALISAESYMIDPQSIVLDLNHIFTDVSTGATELICLPIEGYRTEKDPGKFLKEVLIGAQFDPSEDGAYVTKILTYLNSVPVFSSDDFKLLIEDIEREDKAEKRREESANTRPMTEGELFRGNEAFQGDPGAGYFPGAVQPAAEYGSPVYAAPASAAAEAGAEGQAYIPPDIPKEERISLFYLLQHYNKDRAKQYSEQQKQLKARKAALKGVNQPKKSKQKPKKEKGGGVKAAIPGFRPPAPVPRDGGNLNMGFQIPGKKAPIGGGAPGAAGAGMPEMRNPAFSPAMRNAGTRAPGMGATAAPGPGMRAPAPNPPQPVPAAPHSGGYPAAAGYGAPPQGAQLNFGETTVLGGGNFGETTVLSAAGQPNAQKRPYLIRLRNNERIPVNKDIFRLGKEKSFVDYRIGDNGAISRSHANIVSRGGAYYVVDNNSTNHTFLDGQMVESNVEKPIQNGSRICLANEEFEFRLM